MATLRAKAEFLAACTEGDVVKADLLLRGCKDLKDAKDGDGRGGLHLAARRGHDVVVKLLCKSGFKVGEVDGYGLKPQHLAFDSGFTPLAVYLRDFDAITSRDEEEAMYEEVATRSATASTSASHQYVEPPEEENDHGMERSPRASSDPYEEYYYFLVKTPGRPDLSMRLKGTESFSIVGSAVGLKIGEKHVLYHQSRMLNLTATVGSFGFPLTSPSSPLTIEQRPEIIFCKVTDPSNTTHLVKLGYHQPLSRLLNAPGLASFRGIPLTFLHGGQPLDPRQTPGIYNLPCSIDHPPILRIRLEDGNVTSPLRSILR
eukprot:TRINITY_DN1739_c0_g1_i1.p1 TRINITY_DN1739_c0_g1~~TRINITY_DN1739_c0_g1_i1.p1  ORF type:complete len:332 (+),score=40.40 TRINITY_DN1739_c0_g1_i1:51-998(+)